MPYYYVLNIRIMYTFISFFVTNISLVSINKLLKKI